MKVTAVFDSDRGLRVEITAMTDQEQRIMGLLMEGLSLESDLFKATYPVQATLHMEYHPTYRRVHRIEIVKAGPTAPTE